jgi:large subunit ribosomal protein L23
MATTKTKTKKSAGTVEEKKADAKKSAHPLVLGPRITEKSAIGAEKGIYTFNVARTANKNEIKKAIKMLYNVTPTKVAITQITDKVKVRRGVLGTKSGGKKAVVYLKKGDKIVLA